MIENYTRESGVRQLEKQIDKAFRKLALKQERDNALPIEKIKPEDLEDLLGKPPFIAIFIKETIMLELLRG